MFTFNLIPLSVPILNKFFLIILIFKLPFSSPLTILISLGWSGLGLAPSCSHFPYKVKDSKGLSKFVSKVGFMPLAFFVIYG